MTEKLVVPDGMVKAVGSVIAAEMPGGTQRDYNRAIAEAVIRWLSENPISPTEDQDNALAEWSEEHPDECPFAEWQRRMFKEKQ